MSSNYKRQQAANEARAATQLANLQREAAAAASQPAVPLSQVERRMEEYRADRRVGRARAERAAARRAQIQVQAQGRSAEVDLERGEHRASDASDGESEDVKEAVEEVAPAYKPQASGEEVVVLASQTPALAGVRTHTPTLPGYAEGVVGGGVPVRESDGRQR